jgi:hypothetical protein
MAFLREPDRRHSVRVPVSFVVSELIDELPGRARAINLSCGGIYVQKPLRSIGRNSAVVALEFLLPGEEGEAAIWAKGEIVHDNFDPYLHGSGVRFGELAERDRLRIREFVLSARAEALEGLIGRIQANRRSPSRLF